MEGEKREKISTIDFEDSVNVNIHNHSEDSTSNADKPSSAVATPTDRKVEMTAKSCPVEGVTVFLDRAEVKRLIDVHLEKGKNEITITELPEVMDEDSLRYVFATKRSNSIVVIDPCKRIFNISLFLI